MDKKLLQEFARTPFQMLVVVVHVEVVVVEMVNMMLEVRDDRAMFVLSLVDLIFSALVLTFHENEDPSIECVFLVHAEPIAQNPN